MKPPRRGIVYRPEVWYKPPAGDRPLIAATPDVPDVMVRARAATQTRRHATPGPTPAARATATARSAESCPYPLARAQSRRNPTAAAADSVVTTYNPILPRHASRP